MKQILTRVFVALFTTAILLVGCTTVETQTGTSPLQEDGATGNNNALNDFQTTGNVDSNQASGLNIEASSVEFDELGLEVGFTTEGRPFRGNPNAPVILEEFSDYQCPFCSRFSQQTRPGLLENQVANDDMVLVFYDFPLTSIHAQATAAAHAARCAGEQGAAAYWAMHDRLFTAPGEWSNNRANEVFAGYAQDLGLDDASFRTCQESGRFNDAITADLDFGQSRGVRSTPSFFINDQPLVGAQPLEAFNSAIEIVQSGNALPTEVPPEQPAAPGIAPTPATIVTGNAAVALGNPAAEIIIYEFTDYQCPYCARHALQTMPQILSELIDKGIVYYKLKDFPLDQIHPQARAASAAARCAGEQGAYWEMHDLLFETQQNWSGQENVVEIFSGYAADLKLNEATFESCLSSGKYDDVVQENLDEGISLGVRGTPAFFINGYPISGAQPFELFQYAVELAQEGTLAEAYVQPAEPTPVPTPAGPVNVPIEGAYAMGDPNAPVVIVEFTDFQCPFCARHFNQTLSQIKSNYVDEGLVYYVFRDFPLTSIHPQAVQAAEAARCAGDQGAFLEMYDQLFQKQEEWSGRNDATALFANYASDMNLDDVEFTACIEGKTHQMTVYEELDLGSSLGVQGTPAFFINGYFLSGAQPYSTFEEAIQYFLAEE